LFSQRDISHVLQRHLSDDADYRQLGVNETVFEQGSINASSAIALEVMTGKVFLRSPALARVYGNGENVISFLRREARAKRIVSDVIESIGDTYALHTMESFREQMSAGSPKVDAGP
jgi:hypothetical protein